MAEREGFEPPDLLKGQLISSQPHSTTLAPLQIRRFITRQRDVAHWSNASLEATLDGGRESYH